jgi:hypothetical protein
MARASRQSTKTQANPIFRTFRVFWIGRSSSLTRAIREFTDDGLLGQEPYLARRHLARAAFLALSLARLGTDQFAFDPAGRQAMHELMQQTIRQMERQQLFPVEHVNWDLL